MHHMDVQVLEKALEWAREGETLWFCTVLSTWGSSPRPPGSLLVACARGEYVGSLSGGCVEEAFITALVDGLLDKPVQCVDYGASQEEGQRLHLPCGGVLRVMIERRPADAEWLTHLEVLHATLLGQRRLVRLVTPASGRYRVELDEQASGPVVEEDATRIRVRVGPALRLVLAGISPVATFCAQFAHLAGFEVIVCDPREAERRAFDVPGVEVQNVLPALFIASGATHGATAIVALTHDPRLDDPSMIEAVRTDAFYIGVMGSLRTSRARAERLKRSGGLDDEDIARIHMPVGLDIGSKAPAEIALAVVADIVRAFRALAADETRPDDVLSA
ncbi:XdhC family protein [Larsenimonas rhizosphaerae]|uniref:XdhC family protein n=1 Tax=Larsenimonas rhizosphaerae TaxID=2944682 RepID=A0AA41ZCZ0_9GAMM|nr:XdhC family protein [Larsenimonas rhizosphaerae]MCX2523014.1 XdhC family protein [Larsenimonas rhizosphaerae]